MEDFLMSSNRVGSYNGTFSINSKNNSQRSKEIMKSNEASAKNIEICSTSKFDAQFLHHEIQNIKLKAQSDCLNQNVIDFKLKNNQNYEIKDLTDKEDSNSQRNLDEEDVEFKNNTNVYDFNSQIDLSSIDIRNEVNKNAAYNFSSSFLQQSFSSQLNTIEMNYSNNQHIQSNNQLSLLNIQQISQNNQQPLKKQNLSSQIQKNETQIQQSGLMSENFPLDQNHDVAFDEMLLGQGDSEQQFDDYKDILDCDYNLQSNEIKKQFQQSQGFNPKMNSKQDVHQYEGNKLISQQNKKNNQFLSNPNLIQNDNDKKTTFKSSTPQYMSSQSQNFKVFKSKQSFIPTVNNYLTSEESNSVISNNNLILKSKSLKQQDRLKDKNQSQKYNNRQDNQVSQMNNQIKEIDDDKQEGDRLSSQGSCQNVQFVTLQNDLGDSMQKKSELNQFFNIINSQGIDSSKCREDFLFNNQSAHFSTMNPQYLENLQQLCQQSKEDKIRTDDNSDISNIEQAYDTNSSICAPNRLYNVLQTTEFSDSNSPRIEQQIDFDQTALQERFQFDNKSQQQAHSNYINKNQNQQSCLNMKQIVNQGQTYNNQKENDYKTIDIDKEKKSLKNTLGQEDQELIQKLSKKNQKLLIKNNNLQTENQQLKQELETMKSDLLKKYEDIRKNNENLFKSFEEQSNLMLKKQKENYDKKIQKLQLQLSHSESQNINKKDNFKDRNNQLYEMVLKLEKEKQELHDKNLQLIKKQVNIKNDEHKNLQSSCINTTIDLADRDINKSQINQQSFINYRNNKNYVDDSSLQIDHLNNFNSIQNTQNYFSSQLVSPNSFSTRQNQSKSKSIDALRVQKKNEFMFQDKSNYQNISQQESQFQDFKAQAQKMILENKYDDQFSQYKINNQSSLQQPLITSAYKIKQLFYFKIQIKLIHNMIIAIINHQLTIKAQILNHTIKHHRLSHALQIIIVQIPVY